MPFNQIKKLNGLRRLWHQIPYVLWILSSFGLVTGGNDGTGGQPDTHLGATLCPEGRAIIVLRSTAFDGAVSKIVAKHEAGTLVTIPRYLADTVITEYGVARLLDKNHRQRAEELIRIAHPDFRDELHKQAQELEVLLH